MPDNRGLREPTPVNRQDLMENQRRVHARAEVGANRQCHGSRPVGSPGHRLDDLPRRGRPPGGGDRLPIIPEHLQTLDGIKKTLARHADRAWHYVRFHGVRSPAYLVLAVWWAVVGVARIVHAQLSWWWVTEQTYLRSEAVAAGDYSAWLTLHNHAQKTRKIRGWVLGAEVVGIGIGVGCMVTFAPWWVRALVVAVALPLLARLGRPAHKPIVRPATVTPSVNSDQSKHPMVHRRG